MLTVKTWQVITHPCLYFSSSSAKPFKLRHGLVITSATKLLDTITYSCPDFTNVITIGPRCLHLHIDKSVFISWYKSELEKVILLAQSIILDAPINFLLSLHQSSCLTGQLTRWFSLACWRFLLVEPCKYWISYDVIFQFDFHSAIISAPVFSNKQKC